MNGMGGRGFGTPMYLDNRRCYWCWAFWVFVVILVLGAVMWLSEAKAHDWYSGLRNPTTGFGCCGGADCFKITDLSMLSEDAENFILTFPAETAFPTLRNNFVDSSPGGKGLSLQFRFPKSQAMPTQHVDVDDPDDTGYHACIWGGKPRCFFYPQGA